MSKDRDDPGRVTGATLDLRAPVPRGSAAPSPQSDGRYEIGTEIARGGMGRVVEATDTLLGRTVAVKEALTTDPEALRRFRRETRITARLEHPSIVPVHDAGISPDGSPFYVMRKVSGQPLEQLVAGAHTLADRVALIPRVLAATQAIAHAHRRSVIHRDLKPSNILAGDLGETIVIDWGLAKVIGEPDEDDPHAPSLHDVGSSLRTRIGTVFGTPGFMSPEQLRGDAVDARSDVYALGATLYYVLARRPPHHAPSEDDMMAAAAAGPPPPISAVVPGLPRELSTIVDKALAFDPAARYADAGALADDLQRYLTGQLVASHRYSRRERLIRFVRKHRVPVGIAALAVVAIAIGSFNAIASVLAERDIATRRQHEAEAARAREEERGDQLLITQARAMVATDPTAAVAMIKQLTTPAERWNRTWRKARAVAEAAHAEGVAWGMPGPITPVSLDISPDGKHALATGRDGGIFAYDLVAHRSQRLPELGADILARFVDDTRYITFGRAAITEHDLVTGATVREIHGSERVWFLVGHGEDFYWIDDAGMVWHAGPGATAPERVALWPRAGGARELAVSPDGRWLAVEAGQLGLVDLTKPGSARMLGDEPTPLLQWSDASHLIAAGPHRITTFALDGSPPKVVAFDGQLSGIHDTPSALYAFGGQELYMVADTKLVSLGVEHFDFTRGLHTTWGGHLAVSAGTSVVVLGGGLRYTLRLPTDGIDRLATSQNSKYVVAVSNGHLLAWDVADMLPAASTLDHIVTYLLYGTHEFIANQNGTDWMWGDLATRTSISISGLPPFGIVNGTPEVGQALFVSEDHDLFVLRRGDDKAQRVDLAAFTGVILEKDLAAIVMMDGSVIGYDIATHRTVTWYKHAPPTESIAWDGKWVCVLYADGTMWRLDRRTGRQDTRQILLPPSREPRVLTLRPDGTAYAPVDNKIMRWLPDGSLVDHAALPGPVLGTDSSGGAMIAQTADGTAYVVDLDQPNHLTGTIPSGLHVFQVAPFAGVALFVKASGGMDIVDLVTGDRWPVTPGWAPMYLDAKITPDAKLVSALEGGKLTFWQLELPATPADTAAWLDRLTNARADEGTSTLAWQ